VQAKKTNFVKKKWEETANRYIAFIDIMGFSNYVYRNEHELVKKRMLKFENIVSGTENAARTAAKSIEGLDEGIRTLVFSDSVLVLSTDSSKASLESIIIACQLLVANCLESGIAIKGAISYGKLTADFNKSLFFGKALIDAYQLEEQLSFYGIVIDHKVQKKYRTLNIEPNYILNQSVPTKSGYISHGHVNWERVSETIHKTKSPLEILESFYEDMSGHPRKYVDNTIALMQKAST